MTAPVLPPADAAESHDSGVLLRRLLAASDREHAELRRRLSRTGEFEIARAPIARAD